MVLIVVILGIVANRHKLTWKHKDGERKANYFGSLTQATTVRIGELISGDGDVHSH